MHSDFSVAVHALVYLHHKQTYIQSNELAHTICTNPSRVRKVMAKLNKANLVIAKEGLQGGFKIIERDIALDEVLEALAMEALDMKWMSGSQHNDCRISRSMQSVMTGLLDELNQTVKKQLEKTTIAQLERNIQDENI